MLQHKKVINANNELKDKRDTFVKLRDNIGKFANVNRVIGTGT